MWCVLFCAAVMCKMNESQDLELHRFSGGAADIKFKDDTNTSTAITEEEKEEEERGGSFCGFFRRVPLNQVRRRCIVCFPAYYFCSNFVPHTLKITIHFKAPNS